jgi:hypothetical protein
VLKEVWSGVSVGKLHSELVQAVVLVEVEQTTSSYASGAAVRQTCTGYLLTSLPP